MNHLYKRAPTERMAMTIKEAWTDVLRVAETFLGLTHILIGQKRRGYLQPHVKCVLFFNIETVQITEFTRKLSWIIEFSHKQNVLQLF